MSGSQRAAHIRCLLKFVGFILFQRIQGYHEGLAAHAFWWAQRGLAPKEGVFVRLMSGALNSDFARTKGNPVAGWELRLGDFRVLYDVDESQRVVTVQVVGDKRGNQLIVQGEEFSEHESDRP